MSDSPTSSGIKGGASRDAALWRFFAPRYWPLWLGVALIRAIVWLPFRLQMCIGRALGRLAYPFARRERRIADINLRLCLPGLSQFERASLMQRHFASLGCALVETGLAWWAGEKKFRRLFRVEGFEHLQRALEGGRGAILLSAHSTTLEIGASAMTRTAGAVAMYQPPKNPLIAELSMRARRRISVRLISSDNVRELLRALQGNLAVWYAPDQRESSRSMAIVPFFGVPAATNVATSRIARISGAPVLPYFPERLADGSGYVMRIGPALAGFPSEDSAADALRFHALVEEQVRRCPEQYLWTYKRFKRPGPDGDPYRSMGRSAAED